MVKDEEGKVGGMWEKRWDYTGGANLQYKRGEKNNSAF